MRPKSLSVGDFVPEPPPSRRALLPESQPLELDLLTLSDSQLMLPGLAGDEPEWMWEEDEEEVVVERFVHRTVMKTEVVAALAPQPSGVYVDATVGGGGHTEAILEIEPTVRVIAFDRDAHAIDAARVRLAPYGERVTFVHGEFARLASVLAGLGVSRADGLCADLGVSSPQIDDAARGMSFRAEGPLDMRMNTSSGETALELIGRLNDDDLADVIFELGEERRSRRIARSIKRAYGSNDLKTTIDLRRAVVRAVGPARVGGVDPATRTFQALRIAVNCELEQLDALAESLPLVLKRGAIATIISFHSLEDRIVKHTFANREQYETLWKKPMAPSEEEITQNPRARSAKLRAARLLVEAT